MIHWLLHARLSAGGGTGVVDPPGWNGVTFSVIGYSLNMPVSALASFTIKSDGTWSALSDSEPTEGNWIGTPSAGVGAGYEVRFTVTSLFGSGTIVNQASDWTPISADRTFSVAVARSVSGTTLAIRTVSCEIRPIGGDVVSSSSFTVSASAEVGS